MTDETEQSTRRSVLTLVVEQGPVTAGVIAEELSLTPAAVRRHTAQLLEDGQITDHHPAAVGAPKRGRPARYFVATDAAHESLTDTSAELATEAIEYLREVGGEEAVVGFFHSRTAHLEERYRSVLAGLDARDASAQERVQALADVLSAEGYAATVRQVGDGFAVQLCQGHCPVQSVAENFPELCEAETRAFGRLLGIHVQRLATMPSGGYVCTTHIPLHVPARRSRPVHLTTLTEHDTSLEGSR